MDRHSSKQSVQGKQPRGKHSRVVSHHDGILLDQDLEVLEPSIHRLVATLRPPLLGILLFTTPSQDISRHFGDCWVSTVAIVCFYSLSLSSRAVCRHSRKIVMSLNSPAGKGPFIHTILTVPMQRATSYRRADFRPLLPDVAVGAINTHVGVMRRLELPDFKDDLEKR